MKNVAIAVVVVAACGSKGGATDSTVPAEMIGESVEATRVDHGKWTRYSKGSAIDSEDFAIRRHGDGYVLTSESETWKLSMQVGRKWNVTYFELEVDEKFRQYPRKCTAKLQRNGDQMEFSVAVGDGQSTVRDSHGFGPAGIYWVNMKPMSTQFAICAVAGTAPVSLQNFPAFTVEVAPRQSVDVGDGRKLDKIRVDDLVDIYCDGEKLAIVHYGKHALLGAREEYEAYALQLAASDPTDDVWPGSLECPDK
jgi:hypothetical protein